jgi:hypothetical protein
MDHTPLGLRKNRKCSSKREEAGANPGSGLWALSPLATTHGARETREISSTDALPHTGLLLKPQLVAAVPATDS